MFHLGCCCSDTWAQCYEEGDDGQHDRLCDAACQLRMPGGEATGEQLLSAVLLQLCMAHGTTCSRCSRISARVTAARWAYGAQVEFTHNKGSIYTRCRG